MLNMTGNTLEPSPDYDVGVVGIWEPRQVDECYGGYLGISSKDLVFRRLIFSVFSNTLLAICVQFGWMISPIEFDVLQACRCLKLCMSHGLDMVLIILIARENDV